MVMHFLLVYRVHLRHLLMNETIVVCFLANAKCNLSFDKESVECDINTMKRLHTNKTAIYLWLYKGHWSVWKWKRKTKKCYPLKNCWRLQLFMKCRISALGYMRWHKLLSVVVQLRVEQQSIFFLSFLFQVCICHCLKTLKWMKKKWEEKNA